DQHDGAAIVTLAERADDVDRIEPAHREIEKHDIGRHSHARVGDVAGGATVRRADLRRADLVIAEDAPQRQPDRRIIVDDHACRPLGRLTARLIEHWGARLPYRAPAYGLEARQ